MRAPLTLAAAVLFGVAIGTAPADASCKRFGFTVNDYGKDGPTKDAKELLDKHIAEWAAQQKIKDYKTGTKSVNCELFLNFVVFDEHTCTASANVCWNDGKGSSTPDATSDEATGDVPPTPIRKAALTGQDKTTAATAKTPPAATETAPAAPPTDTAAVTPPEAPPAVTEPAPSPPTQPAKAAEVTPPPALPAVVETGTLPKDPLSALKKHAAADAAAAPAKSVEIVPDAAPIAPAAPVAPAATASKRDPAAATAAATAAAAAAERAAVAAETAAAAAKEAAAAAVAASAASRGSVVPPLDAGP
jgi:hypothetical protein